jgi:hypothetical protein
VEAEPWGRARRSFLWRLRLDSAVVSLILAGGTTVGAGQVALFSLNAPAIRSFGEAIWPRLLLHEACPSWASGESKVRPLLEEALGRGVNPPGSTVPARGWARARRDRAPGVDGALTCIAPIRPLQLVLMWLPAEFRSLGGTPNYGPRQ